MKPPLPLLEKSQNVLDLQITYCIKNNYRDQSRLLQFIKKNPKNQSFLYFINMVFYVVDTIKNFTTNNGYDHAHIELDFAKGLKAKEYYTVGKNWDYVTKNYLLNHL